MGEGPLHIVLFPWLASGHLIPFLELSKSLAKRGHHILFLSTPRNIHRLPRIPLPLLPLIDFISIPLPPSDDLTDDSEAEATSDLPRNKVSYLKKAFDQLDQPIAEFLEQASPKPDWIICDFAPHWLPPIASKLNIPCAFFNPFPSFFSAFTDGRWRSPELLTARPEWIPFPTKVAYRLHEALSLAKSVQSSDASGASDSHRFSTVVKSCDLVAMRGCTEFDGEWLSLLPKLYDKPVIPLGLLPPSADEGRHGGHGLMASTGHASIARWLSEQTPESVVYVSLGSEATLSAELAHELAFGLELSGLPFLWALGRMSGEVELRQKKGFEDRIAGRGIVAVGWMPQLEILAHSSVGGFLTHCGWNSLIEGLAFGHPLVLLPIFADQGINARVMVEKGVGLEVERDEETGSFTREAVAKALRLVMVEEEGKKLRKMAKEMKGVFGNKDIHEPYVDTFVHYLRDHRL